MQKARSVIPNMCWYLAKALMPNGKAKTISLGTSAIEKAPLARRVSARILSTTEIPREDNGARDGRMDSHGHPSGDPILGDVPPAVHVAGAGLAHRSRNGLRS